MDVPTESYEKAVLNGITSLVSVATKSAEAKDQIDSACEEVKAEERKMETYDKQLMSQIDVLDNRKIKLENKMKTKEYESNVLKAQHKARVEWKRENNLKDDEYLKALQRTEDKLEMCHKILRFFYLPLLFLSLVFGILQIFFLSFKVYLEVLHEVTTFGIGLILHFLAVARKKLVITTTEEDQQKALECESEKKISISDDHDQEEEIEKNSDNNETLYILDCQEKINELWRKQERLKKYQDYLMILADSLVVIKENIDCPIQPFLKDVYEHKLPWETEAEQEGQRFQLRKKIREQLDKLREILFTK